VDESGLRFEVSISHDRNYAFAQVIGYSGCQNSFGGEQ